jgi:hypothetical protein
MNSLPNLTTAKLRRTLLIAALVVCPFLAVPSGNAQPPVVTAQLLTSNGTNTISITGNQTFTLQLIINTNFISSGITVFMQTGANGSGLFRITDRMFTMQGGSPFPYEDPTATNATVLTPANALLDPVNNNDLGATDNDFSLSAAAPAGQYSIFTLTFSTLNAANGQYTIFTDRGVVTDRTGDGFQDRAFSALATINVIPEPTTVGLAVIGGGMLLVAGWRKRRTRA